MQKPCNLLLCTWKESLRQFTVSETLDIRIDEHYKNQNLLTEFQITFTKKSQVLRRNDERKESGKA
jgi:hypothetical protein